MSVEGDFIKLNKWLAPLSWIYGAVVGIRNALFDNGVLKSRSFDIPVISVGNITVGGAGKTPHAEYLVELLQDTYKVAVLSRGYKRKTRGYRLANADTKMTQIGDEPYQMHKKFPNAHVVVDANRCHGIDRIITDEATKDTQVVVLDDAFQHRYVKPGLNILLVDYHRLIIYDELLPVGRLREPKKGKDRADIVIVTKCPKETTPMGFRVLQRALNLYPYQELYFTTMTQLPLKPLFAEGKPLEKSGLLPNVLLLSGIASPEQIVEDMRNKCTSITPMHFPDHHQYTKSDAEAINTQYKMMSKPAIIITTEKDATRLENLPNLSAEVRAAMYVQPIRVTFMQDEEEKFNERIKSYVRKNQRDSRMAEETDNAEPATDGMLFRQSELQGNPVAADNSNSAGDRPRTISF